MESKDDEQVEDQDTEESKDSQDGSNHEDHDVGSPDGGTSASTTQHHPDPTTPAGASTPNAHTTPGQQSAGTRTPLTPGQHQVPIQPYAYPPYPYYPPAPGYAPPPGSHLADQMMTGSTNPYQYTDVSNMGDPMPDTRRNRGGVTEPFPEKLHRMLEITEREGLTDVVSFFSHGRAFAIHKPRRFVTETMPRFFRQTRLTSFQRQLNLYGFRRISQGPDNGGYYHELFLKGRSGLCVNMKRTKVKGAAKLKRDPDSEPNFYSYPPITPHTMPTSHIHASPISTGSPGRPVGSSPAAIYPGYAYPPPPYPYPPVPNAPYTAAQQPTGPQMYPYPPYYAYPYMYPPPPPHQAGHMPPTSSSLHNMSTPQTSPIRTGQESKIPDGEGSPFPGVDTPGSIDSSPENAVTV